MKNKLKVYRAINEVTQAELAEAVGVTNWTISQLELNNYAPSVTLALRIAKVLNTTVHDIFFLDEDYVPVNNPYLKKNKDPEN